LSSDLGTFEYKEFIFKSFKGILYFFTHGRTNYFSAQQPLGPENPIKTIDFTDHGGGWKGG